MVHNKSNIIPDVIAIGNAIVDQSFMVSDSELMSTGIEKGSMTLLNKIQLERLQSLFKIPQSITPGGSTANTIIGYAAAGGMAGYIGRVSDDCFGEVFVHKMSDFVHHKICMMPADAAGTATCMVFVTPDKERTMATYLGVCGQLHITEDELKWAAQAKVLIVEGYLCGQKASYDSVCDAAIASIKNENHVMLTLSSLSCIQYNFENMIHMVENFATIVIGTVDEGMAISESESIEKAIKFFQKKNIIGALTDGENGAYIFNELEFVHVPAPHVEKIVDTTGAGDQFAAGYLVGLLGGKDLMEIGGIASQCAAKILGVVGAHPVDIKSSIPSCLNSNN